MSLSRAAVVAAALGVAVSVVALGAYAVTARFSTDLPAPITEGNASRVPMSTNGNPGIDLMHSSVDGITPIARSPSAGTLFQSMALYHSVPAGAEARHVPGGLGAPQAQPGLLFGAADSRTMADLVSPGQLGLDVLYLQISDASFDEARMSWSRDTFESTNIFSLAAVPVPASLTFLLGGLVGLRLLAHRRRADQA